MKNKQHNLFLVTKHSQKEFTYQTSDTHHKRFQEVASVSMSAALAQLFDPQLVRVNHPVLGCRDFWFTF